MTKKIKGVKELRGIGLMLGIELHESCTAVRNELLNKHKIFTGSSSNKNTIRILPALNINKEHADIFLIAFSEVMSMS